MKRIRSYVDHTVLVRALSSVLVSTLGSQDGSPKGWIRNGGGRYRQELRHPLGTAPLLGSHLVAIESTVDFVDCTAGAGGAFPRYVSVVFDRAIGVRSVAL
eukprot:2345063-Amphidinium_carterae.1